MTLFRSYLAAGAAVISAAACTPQPPPPPSPAVASAVQQLPPGRVYVFHSTAQSSCPALDWHVVLTPDGALDGVIAWNNMQSLAHASGSINAQSRDLPDDGTGSRRAASNGHDRWNGHAKRVFRRPHFCPKPKLSGHYCAVVRPAAAVMGGWIYNKQAERRLCCAVSVWGGRISLPRH